MTATKPALREGRQALTARQREVYRLRHDYGASVDQIARWLKISPRAVFYRLQCANRRLGDGEFRFEEQAEAGRTYSASQIAAGGRGDFLNIDDL
jgi:DNA-binding CsgD family transcriptional regulator